MDSRAAAGPRRVTLRTLGNVGRAAASSLGMHAYQHFVMGRATVIVDPNGPRSTRRPASHRTVRRPRGHLFTMLDH
jgi:hypothetical protein